MRLDIIDTPKPPPQTIRDLPNGAVFEMSGAAEGSVWFKLVDTSSATEVVLLGWRDSNGASGHGTSKVESDRRVLAQYRLCLTRSP